MAAINLTKGGFERRIATQVDNLEKLNFLGNKPALIDFYATWCGPCQRFAPILESVSEQYVGKVDIYKVDVDSEEALSSMFNIRSIPTLVFISASGDVQRVSGAMSELELKERLNNLIK